jgi:hypothetical protein
VLKRMLIEMLPLTSHIGLDIYSKVGVTVNLN